MPALDVAVVCAIPLEREEWLERARSAPCGDFVRSFAATRFDGDVDKAWSYFQAEARFVNRRLDMFESWGALVCRHATTSDLRDAASRRSDFVVLAHWKGEGVGESDVREPLRVREAVSTLGLDVPPIDLAREPGAAAIAATLDDYVGASLRWTADGRATTDSILASIARRERLEGIPGLAGGNRVELWDAMVRSADFAALLGRDRIRTLYLAICTSNYLLETVRRASPATICLASRDTMRADITLLKLSAALNLCRLEDRPLWQAVAMAGEIFDQVGSQ